jgi:4-aminobutyrate aminotransferase
LLGGVVHAHFPDPYHPTLISLPGEPYGETVVRYIEEELFEKILPAEDIAGIWSNRFQGEGGYVIPAAVFSQRCENYATGMAFC